MNKTHQAQCLHCDNTIDVDGGLLDVLMAFSDLSTLYGKDCLDTNARCCKHPFYLWMLEAKK